MNSARSHITALGALIAGAVYAFNGALQVTNDFSGSHNTLDSTAEYLVTGSLPVSLLATIPAYLAFGHLARAPRVAAAAIAPQVVLALMCVFSVLNGEDGSFFNAVAPVCLLTWLVSSSVLAVRLRRAGAVPKPVAIALPLLIVTTFPLSIVGGPLLTGAFWLAIGSHALREGALTPATA